jgi:hypothetical protein
MISNITSASPKDVRVSFEAFHFLKDERVLECLFHANCTRKNVITFTDNIQCVSKHGLETFRNHAIVVEYKLLCSNPWNLN